MWTYLAIFLSISVVIGVFVRRVFLYYKGKDEKEDSTKGAEQDEKEKKKLERISRKDKGRVEALVVKAEGKVKAGKEDEAIKLFVQALAIDQHHLETQNRLAMLYMKKQMYSAAAALFKNLGELTEDAVHYSHLGLAYYNQSLLGEAKEAYQRAVSLDPSRPQRFVSLSLVYKSLGDLANAVIALNKARELDQENIDYLFLYAELQTDLGNLDEAAEIVNKILELDKDNEEAKTFLKRIKTMIKNSSLN